MSEVVIKVYAYDLSEVDLKDLFDRVVHAAHAKDEQVICVGAAPVEGDE